MKQIPLIIISILIGQSLFAQTDSVFLSINSKLIPEIQIITSHGENGTRENYTYFKYRYWIGEIDTVSMSIIDNTELGKSKKNKSEYLKYGVCDSIINKIRNNSHYWRMRSDIAKMERQEIGYGNVEFNHLKDSENYRIDGFSSRCHDEFKTGINELKEQLIREIKRIKSEKIDRYNRLKTSPETIGSTEIDSFLKTFDLCDTDLKTLELIIIQNPSDFINSIDKLTDSEFFTFTVKLDDFLEDSNVSKMKETLKESEQRSNRKKKLIRKIEKRKANNS